MTEGPDPSDSAERASPPPDQPPDPERPGEAAPVEEASTALYATAPPLVPAGADAGSPGSGGFAPASPIDEIAPPLVPTDPPPLDPTTPAAPVVPPPPPGPPIPLVPTRGLLGTAFDLLSRSRNDMRRASFYAGGITLGTVGPLVLAVLILEQEGVFDETGGMSGADAGVALVLFVLGCIAFAGLLVAVVEARNLGFLVLGGQMAGRPVTTRQALARSRRVFWPTVGAALVVGLVIGVAQAIAQAVLDEVLVEATEIGFIVSTLVAAVVGAPFAYTLAGVILGDVGPIEGIRRSFRVFRARRSAAFIVVLFESVAFLLVVLGLETGLDLVIRVFQTLGLGPDAGPLGFALTVVGIVALVFAFGTLLFTVYALTVAPQVVMFLGLTHATYGLDVVRPGGRDDPAASHRRRGTYGWFSTGMVVAFLSGAVGLVLIVAYALA